MNDNEIVEAIKEMMDVWNRLMAEARAMLPDATPAELYEAVSSAMNRSFVDIQTALPLDKPATAK